MMQGFVAHPFRQRQRRAGFLYVAVLFTSLVLIAIVATSLSVSASKAKLRAAALHRATAMRAAESEVFRFAATMRENVGWRTENQNDQFSPWRDPAGSWISADVSVRHRLSDTDGSLDDRLSDPVTLTVHARSGEAEYAVSVDLEVGPEPADFLQHSITVVDDFVVDNGTVTAERAVQVGGDLLSAVGSIVLTTPVADVGGIVDVTVRGEVQTAQSFASVDLAAAYEESATSLDVTQIPRRGQSLLIENRLLSAAASPFSATNDQGIYLLNAEGRRVSIGNCRIVGTLVIIDASEVVISDAMQWEPVGLADAILVSDSPVLIEDLEGTLSESESSANFNPASTPYRSLGSDADLSDTYPTSFRGLIQTLSDIRITANSHPFELAGTIIGDDIRTDGTVRVSQLDHWLQAPPPQLRSPTAMQFLRGTWRRIESPSL